MHMFGQLFSADSVRFAFFPLTLKDKRMHAAVEQQRSREKKLASEKNFWLSNLIETIFLCFKRLQYRLAGSIQAYRQDTERKGGNKQHPKKKARNGAQNKKESKHNKTIGDGKQLGREEYQKRQQT